jgi:hypothetical protein
MQLLIAAAEVMHAAAGKREVHHRYLAATAAAAHHGMSHAAAGFVAALAAVVPPVLPGWFVLPLIQCTTHPFPCHYNWLAAPRTAGFRVHNASLMQCHCWIAGMSSLRYVVMISKVTCDEGSHIRKSNMRLMVHMFGRASSATWHRACQ